MWLIHTIHPLVWLFLNTAIVFLIDFKSDVYLDSLSANRAVFFIRAHANDVTALRNWSIETKQIK